MFRVVYLADYFGDLATDANLRRALHETLSPPVPLFSDCDFDEDRIYEKALHGPRTYGALLDAVMSDFASRRGKPRWSEKTPGQSLAGVLGLLPDAQAVHIIRDPRAVVASSRQTPWELMPPARVARAWARFTADTLRTGRAAGPLAYHEVRYEDLVSEPEAVLRGVCTFLEEDYEAVMVDESDGRRWAVPTLGAQWPLGTPWHSRVLDPIRMGPPARLPAWDDRARVWAKVGTLATHLGYEPSRRGTIVLGRVLNLATSPASVPHALGQVRLRRAIRRPDTHYRAVQHWMRQRTSATDASLERASGTIEAEAYVSGGDGIS